jgi:hypothetical protein
MGQSGWVFTTLPLFYFEIEVAFVKLPFLSLFTLF